MNFALFSPSFEHDRQIPRRHTCEGDDLSPALQWREPPDGTKSFALIVDDPDAPDPAAPKMTWVHWVVYRLPADCRKLDEGVKTLPGDALEGLNDWKRKGYGGPCPPIGRHRYFHKLYSLSAMLPDLGVPTKDALLRAMAGHLLGEAVLIGTYEKGR